MKKPDENMEINGYRYHRGKPTRNPKSKMSFWDWVYLIGLLSAFGYLISKF